MQPRHDDMLGQIRSAIAGGTQWTLGVLRDTAFVVGWLADNSTDFFQTSIQATHRRRLRSNLDSIHVHGILESAATAGETLVFTGSYAWLNPGDSVPANASWTSFGTVTIVLPASSAFHYNIWNIGVNIPFPITEGYGGMLLIQITRGNGTHAGRFGVLDCDAHSIMDRLGSIQEYND